MSAPERGMLEHLTPIKVEYEDRIVAFIDVLGSSELITKSESDVDCLQRVNKLVTTDKLFERFMKHLPFAAADFFSDSFILSMPVENALYLLRECGYLCRHLLLQGFPCRGAITIGPLYHRDRIVVGPALVRAYQLEQGVAIYPRVVLDAKAVEYWADECSSESAHPHLLSLVKRDRDGQKFLDIFNPMWTQFLPWTDLVPSEPLVPNTARAFLSAAEEQIRRGLAASRGVERIQAKYQWLASECLEYAGVR
jgi:hypothetical protein